VSRFPVDEVFWRRTADSELVSFGRNYSVLLVDPGTEDPITLWSAEEGGVEVVQPLTTDDEGRALGKGAVRPWSDTADYDLIVNGERFPKRAPAGSGGGGAVDSVNGKTGNVTGLEETANKDTSSGLGSSDTKYPSQKAVKTYVDTAVSAKQDASTAATDAELAAHAADSTSVHGITDTSKLVTESELEASAKGVCIYDEGEAEWPPRPAFASVEFQSPEGVEEHPDAVDGDTWLQTP
jgi:hypothetical protein